jgi:hypothetical protein
MASSLLLGGAGDGAFSDGGELWVGSVMGGLLFKDRSLLFSIRGNKVLGRHQREYLNLITLSFNRLSKVEISQVNLREFTAE